MTQNDYIKWYKLINLLWHCEDEGEMVEWKNLVHHIWENHEEATHLKLSSNFFQISSTFSQFMLKS